MAQADPRSITRRPSVAASAAKVSTGSSRKIPGREARFPRLRQIRTEQLGWEITDIVTRLPGHRPSAASIYRLEQGHAIRVANARRVFDLVNAALNNALDSAKELEVM